MIPTKKVLIPVLDDEGVRRGVMEEEISEQCAACRHWTVGLCCKAFPQGIPEEIRKGDFDHRRAYPDDRGIRYEPIHVS